MRPDEEHLAQSISTAFDALAAPSATRLKEIEERVARHIAPPVREKKSRMGFWWLFGALAVTGAAAWWAGDYLGNESSKTSSEQHVPAATDRPAPSGSSSSERERQEKSLNAGSSVGPKDSSKIYRREAY